MKKLKSLVAVAGATVLLTSCLDGGSNEASGVGYGVVDYTSDFVKVAYISDYLGVYSPQFEPLNTDDCVAFAFNINYDDPANNGSKKYLTATVSNYAKLDVATYTPVVDTTNASIQKGELTTLNFGLCVSLDNTGTTFGTAKNHLFVNSTHPNSSNDQTNRYILLCDPNQTPQTVDGKNVYDCFVRVVKQADGKNTVGNATYTYAYRIGSALEPMKSREKAAGNKQVYLRFNYIKEFNKDSTEAIWDKTQPLNFPIIEDETKN